jgi:hypothetical protein
VIESISAIRPVKVVGRLSVCNNVIHARVGAAEYLGALVSLGKAWTWPHRTRWAHLSLYKGRREPVGYTY